MSPLHVESAPPATGTGAAPVPARAGWRDVILGFVPAHRRTRAARWIGHLPLLLIMALQAVLTLRLSNTAYRDEALYIWTGHRIFQYWFDGAQLYDNPSSYFSGSPFVYPPLAALIDIPFGLGGVRAFSLLCMGAATVAIWAMTTRMFGRRAAVLAAAAFVVCGLVQHLGNFATFDALALVLLAGGTALGLRGLGTHRIWWAAVGGTLLAVAVTAKYASLMFVPAAFALLLLAPVGRPVTGRSRLAALAASAGTFGVVLVTWALTIGRNDVTGFMLSTVSRTGPMIVDPDSFAGVVGRALGFAGPWYLLMVVGGIMLFVRRRNRVLAAVLFGAAILPVLYQGYLGEAVSLDKHIAFGLVFGVPLIGVIAGLATRAGMTMLLGLVLVVLTIYGAATSSRIFSAWSNTKALTDVMAYKFAAAPYIRTLGEPFEPVRYAFVESTEYWQWATTDPIEALYFQTDDGQPLRGIAAAKAGLQADYWQVVYLNGSTGASQELEPLLPGFGYQLTDTVNLQNANGPDVYRIWQRFN